MGWSLLTKDAPDSAAAQKPVVTSDFQDKEFYPLTFPITAGPGTVVVTLTLSAHASRGTYLEIFLAHVGVLIGIGLVAVSVYIAYAYADRTTARLSASVVQGILRIISFILVCIGAQIMWKGIELLTKSLH
jgi:multiple antibiotic resistance protein